MASPAALACRPSDRKRSSRSGGEPRPGGIAAEARPRVGQRSSRLASSLEGVWSVAMVVEAGKLRVTGGLASRFASARVSSNHAQAIGEGRLAAQIVMTCWW